MRLWAISWLTLCASSLAQEAPPTPAPPDTPAAEWKTGTDNLFGTRPKLQAHGITLDASFTADLAKSLRGGLNTEGYNFGHLLNVSLGFDLEKLHGWRGGQVYLNLQYEAGEFATSDVGDLQIADNIDADGRTQVSEIWLGQNFFDEKLKIKLGKMDANSDFNTVRYSGDFINSSASLSPNILGLPTYPDPAFGAQVFYHGERFSFGAGIFDGAAQEGIRTGSRGPATLIGDPADLFIILEAGLNWTLGAASLPGEFSSGVWRHTGSFDRFDGGTEHGTAGFYTQADQLLYRKGNNTDTTGIGLFLRYSWADPDVSAIEHHLGAGITWDGPFPARENDRLGVAINSVLLGRDFGTGDEHHSETALEAFYKIEICPWCHVQPDVQYILNPSGTLDARNAWLAILRINIDL